MAENFCYSCLAVFVFFHLLIYSVLHISENFLGAGRSVLVSNNYLNQVWLSEIVALMLAPSLAKVGQKSFIWSYYWVSTKNWMGEIDCNYKNICENNHFVSYLTCLLLWSYILNPKCLPFKYLRIKFPVWELFILWGHILFKTLSRGETWSVTNRKTGIHMVWI